MVQWWPIIGGTKIRNERHARGTVCSTTWRAPVSPACRRVYCRAIDYWMLWLPQKLYGSTAQLFLHRLIPPTNCCRHCSNTTINFSSVPWVVFSSTKIEEWALDPNIQLISFEINNYMSVPQLQLESGHQMMPAITLSRINFETLPVQHSSYQLGGGTGCLTNSIAPFKSWWSLI